MQTELMREEPLLLLSRLRGDWNALRSSVLSLRRPLGSTGSSQQATEVTKDDVVKVYTSRHRSSNIQEDRQLLEASLADSFDRADLARSGAIGEVQWLHDGILQKQAPSLDALLQVNRQLEVWVQEDPSVQSQLLDLFLQFCEGHPEPWLNAAQMRRVAERWIAQGSQGSAKARNLKQQSIHHLQDLLNRNAAESEHLHLTSGGLPGLSYYDFLTHMLGCAKARVQLYHYDLSNGRAKWLSVLVGHELEGIWHTSIVVHNKEYWYGGRVLISEPGTSPFGAPMKIVDLPGLTTKTDAELLKFLRRELAHKFNSESYDVLNNNCNHFSDAVCVFLLNRHLPEEILQQPALVMNSRAVQIVRPLLNKVLGRLDGTGLWDDEPRKSEIQDSWSEIAEGNLVLWEFKEGWTRIARLLVKAEEACDLRWLDTTSGQLRLAAGVERAAVRRWMGSPKDEASAQMPRRVQEKPCPKRRLRTHKVPRDDVRDLEAI